MSPTLSSPATPVAGSSRRRSLCPAGSTLKTLHCRREARVGIDDLRSAKRLCEGYVSTPGRTVDRSGQTWEIGVAGAQQVLNERRRP